MIKKAIHKIYTFLFNKQIILSCSIVLLFVVFHTPIQDLLSNTLVKLLFSKINSTWYNDLVAITILFVSVIFLFEKYDRYTPSPYIRNLLIIFSMMYLFYRVFYEKWIFVAFSFSGSIKYLDIFVLVSIGNLILFIRGEKPLPKNNADSFFEDKPLGVDLADELGYESYALQLAGKIRKSNFEKSFAIGINGNWGFGKTSFIDLIKRNLCDEEFIEIEFNPWNSHSSDAIILDFFQAFQEKIGPFHSLITRQLVSYANKLVDLKDNAFNLTVRAVVTAFTGVDSIHILTKEIDRSLREINRKIVICVDDVDRLNTTEIVEVMKLIRNTADFYNTFFIVAYDREYIINSLKDYNGYNQDQFLEKIFQLEITLPYFNKDILRRKLLEKLKNAIPESFHPIIEQAVVGKDAILPVPIRGWVESMRDVTRLANSISLNINKLLGEIDFYDFLKIEMLRVKYPSVYQLLFTQGRLFLKADQKNGNVFRYRLVNIQEISPKPDTKETQGIYLKIYLTEHRANLSIPAREISKIVDLLSGIFAEGIAYGFYQKSILSIIYPSKFKRYFAYALPEGNLSEVEFSKARGSSLEEFCAQITGWVSKNMIVEVQNRLKEIKNFDSKADFEKVIRVIFYFANLLNQNIKGLILHDYNDLFDKMADYQGSISDRFYETEGGRKGLRNFIADLFRKAVFPYTFEAGFISSINSGYFDKDYFPLTREELKAFSIGYFKSYCNSVKKLDDNIISLFWQTEQSDHVLVGNQTFRNEKGIPAEAKQIFTEFIKDNDLDGFILRIIDPEPFGKKIFGIQTFPLNIYDGWRVFKEMLIHQDEAKWKYLKEFKEFFSECEKTNFSKYIKFDFRTIPIQEKSKTANSN
jgi:KAP family P-loop domain